MTASPPPPSRSAVFIAARVVLNVIFWTLTPIVTLLFLWAGTIGVVVYGMGTFSRRNALWMIRRTISWYGATVLRLAWPFVKIRYVDLDPGATGPFVFVANHRAASDGFLMACLPEECVQIMNIWPTRIPIFGQVSRLAGYMSVRELPFDDFLAQGQKLLSQGVSIIAFPEGTRSGSKQMGPFHGSVFRLAMAQGAKVVPLAIDGNEHIPPRGSFWLCPGRITITRLPALGPAEYHDYNAFVLKNKVRDFLQAHLDHQA